MKINIIMNKEEFEKLKVIITKIFKKNKVKKAGIFGSFALGTQNKNSDVDILIDFDGSLLDMIKLEMELEKKLKKKIDLVSYNGLNSLIKERILNEEVRII